MNPWDDDKFYPPAEWQAEVEDGVTRLGYADWVQAQYAIATEI